MVDLIAAKKAALNNKALNEISYEILFEDKFKITENSDEKIVVEAGDYKVTFISDKNDEFDNFGLYYAGTTLKNMPAEGTIDKIIVKKDGKADYKIKNADLDVEDILEMSFDKDVDGKEIAKSVFDDDDFICGSNKNDKLYGFDGDDTIKTRKGKDKAVGGDGDDNFRVNEYGPKNYVKVKDFDDGSVGADRDMFELGSKFGSLGSTLTNDEFVVGDKATSNSAQMIYDEETGELWYERDGMGGKDAKLVAELDKFLDLDADHFLIL